MGSLHSASRVREIWTGTTTSSITLSGTAASGPPGGYRTFATGCGNGLDYRCLIEHRTAAEWMIARFTYNSGTGVLTYVSLESSSTGSQVTFSAGTKHIAIVWGHTDSLAPEFYGSATVGGNLVVGGVGAGPYQINILEPSAGGTSGTGFKAPALAADVIYTLPTADGTSGQALVTDGSKVLSWAGRREQLTAARTYYVRTDGSNSNTGLANTAGGAFLTIQKAVDVACALDLSIYAVTIQLGAGTYTGSTTLYNYTGRGPITIVGDTTTPSNVLVSTTSANCFQGDTVYTPWKIEGLEVRTTTSGDCFRFTACSGFTLGAMKYGASAAGHITGLKRSRITLSANYTISGNAGSHWSATNGSSIDATGLTVTLSGTPALTYFVYCEGSGTEILCPTMTFSGSATGTRYFAAVKALISTSQVGVNYLPGNAAGTPATQSVESATGALYN